MNISPGDFPVIKIYAGGFQGQSLISIRFNQRPDVATGRNLLSSYLYTIPRFPVSAIPYIKLSGPGDRELPL